MATKQKKMKYHIVWILVISVLVMIATFCAYMLSTSLESVLFDQRGVEVVTHDNNSGNS